MQKTIIGFWSLPRKTRSLLVLFLTALFFLHGCFKGSDISEEKAYIKLKKVDYSELLGWNEDDFAQVIPVFKKNCLVLLKNNKENLSNSIIKINTEKYKGVCNKFAGRNINSASKMKNFIKDEFDVYAVYGNNSPEGKFTSYYEAVIRASFAKSAKYKYPIYGKPKDLVEINLRDFGSELPDTRLVGRVDNGRFVPYYKREYIENNAINAPVIMWGDDPVDIHFMQIQGSAVAHMADGSELRVGYADNNGHKFRGLGSILIENKLIKPGEASMPKIREWLRKNPEKASEIMLKNERFIFQKLSDADGPVGALGVSLTAGRSLAVDNRYIPLGVMMWLDTKNPDKENLQKIVFAQDIGGAIKGAVRGDYFWGHGEEALQEAGRMNSAGRYYIFVPKNSTPKVY